MYHDTQQIRGRGGGRHPEPQIFVPFGLQRFALDAGTHHLTTYIKDAIRITEAIPIHANQVSGRHELNDQDVPKLHRFMTE